jgi:hypothetical protein
LREPDRRRDARIRDRHDDVGRNERLACKLDAEALADLINTSPAGDRVGAGEIDVLEDARTGRAFGERAMAFDTLVRDHHHFAVVDLAHELRATDVEGARLRGEHISVAETAEHERPDADGIARADQHVVGQANERVGAFDLEQRIDEPLDDAALLRA